MYIRLSDWILLRSHRAISWRFENLRKIYASFFFLNQSIWIACVHCIVLYCTECCIQFELLWRHNTMCILLNLITWTPIWIDYATGKYAAHIKRLSGFFFFPLTPNHSGNNECNSIRMEWNVMWSITCDFGSSKMRKKQKSKIASEIDVGIFCIAQIIRYGFARK